jgi:hypothetical protein
MAVGVLVAVVGRELLIRLGLGSAGVSTNGATVRTSDERGKSGDGLKNHPNDRVGANTTASAAVTTATAASFGGNAISRETESCADNAACTVSSQHALALARVSEPSCGRMPPYVAVAAPLPMVGSSPLVAPTDPLELRVVAHRVAGAKPLLIKEIAAEVESTIREGHRVVNLSQGVPCLPLFDAAKEAMASFVSKGQLPYSAVAGIPEVRDSCARFVRKMFVTFSFIIGRYVTFSFIIGCCVSRLLDFFERGSLGFFL